ncbi:MAG: lipid-A-disaccharide synthase [Limnochordaceae bacterium]|nr:lipid-A-disaccharide synthase [Limnochordaceae bacterium]
MKEIWISAGEASGDLHGSALAEQLRLLQPGCRLRGLGGPLMAKAGVDLIYDPTALSTVGFLESLRVTPVLHRLLQRVGGLLESAHPDVLVVIDFPGFNIPLAELAHARHVPVVYYLPPTAWLWGEGRAQRVAQACARVLCALPVEEEVYRRAGARTRWVGHPLVDRVQRAPTVQQAREQLGVVEGEAVFALLPGSRQREVEELLPAQLQAAQLISAQLPQARFFLPLAVTIPQELVHRLVDAVPIRVTLLPGPEGVYPALRASEAAVVASGTATLEATLLGTPAVIVYKTSLSTFWIGRRLLHLQQIGLPNLLAGRPILPELLQGDVKGERIAEWLLRYHQDQKLRQATQTALAEVGATLGSPGAVVRAAREILQVMAEKDETASE